MRISLILTGSDRYADLERFFSNLQHSAAYCSAEVELIFVNQGAFCPPVAAGNSSSFVLNELKYCRLPLSCARNIGLQDATGEILGFPDDDCWYSPLLLDQVATYFCEHPATAAICTNVYDPILQRSYGDRPLGSRVWVDFKNLFELPISVGIFIRRGAFEAVGLHFDEKLGAGTAMGSGEETDLVYRLLKSGALVEYVGTIQVFHPVPQYQEADIEKYFRYGLGFGYLNGRILRDGEFRVMNHLGLVLIRSLGGAVLNLHSSTSRRLYWNRLLGIVQGFMLGVRGLPC